MYPVERAIHEFPQLMWPDSHRYTLQDEIFARINGKVLNKLTLSFVASWLRKEWRNLGVESAQKIERSNEDEVRAQVQNRTLLAVATGE